MQPRFEIFVDGKKATGLYSRLIGIKIDDETGEDSDKVTLTFEHEPGLDIPSTNPKIRIFLGFETLHDMGEFYMDEFEYLHDQRIQTLSGKGFLTKSKNKSKRSQSYEKLNLGEIVEDIAARNKLKSTIDPELKSFTFKEKQVQKEESDLHFLTRILKPLDGVQKIRGDILVVAKKGSSRLSSGETLGRVAIDEDETAELRYLGSGRQEYGKAAYKVRDKKTGEIKTVETPGSGEILRLGKTYNDPELAKQAAESALRKARRGKEEMSFDLPRGKAELRAESIVDMKCSVPSASGEWVVDKVEHEYSKGSGLVSRLTLKRGK
jgi:phage protein D